MLRLGPTLLSLAIVVASSCAPERDADLGTITLVLGGEGALFADGRALLPVFVRSVDGEGRPHPARMIVTTSLGDVLDPSVDNLVGPRIALRGDGAVFFLRCPLGGEGDAHILVERPDGVSAEVFPVCLAPRSPRLELEVSECVGYESYDGEECPLRARVILESHAESQPARAAPVIFRVSTSAEGGPAPLDASLVIAGGQPTNEVTVRTDGSGYAEVKLLPPALFAPYDVTLWASAVTSAGVVDSGPVTLVFPFTDRSALSVAADNTMVGSSEETLLVVTGARFDGAPAAGAEVVLVLDDAAAAAGALLVRGDDTATTLTLSLDDDGIASALFRAPPVVDLMQVVVHASMSLPHSATELLDDVSVSVNPQTVLDVHVSAPSMDNASAATLTATVSRTGADLVPAVGQSVTFALDVTSADVARLDGATATVMRTTDHEGRASVIVTAASADSVGAAVVRVTAVVDDLAFEELVVVDVISAP